MRLGDQHIIDALLAKEEALTYDFFYVWCRPLLYSLIRKTFPYPVDYDELVGELYLHLMENNGRRLRTFQGRSSIYQWMKCVAARFFLEKRDAGVVIDDNPADSLYLMDEPTAETGSVEEDIRRLIAAMKNPRYRLVIRKILLEGVEYEELAEELHTSVANLYNIKSRAMKEFSALVSKEYGNG